MTLFKLCLFSSSSLLLIACGGGGGGGSDSSNTVSYTGKNTATTIQSSNAPTLIDNAFNASGNSASSLIGVENDSPLYSSPIIATLNNSLKFINNVYLGDSLIGIEVDETNSCTTSGTTTVKGDIDDNNGDFSGSIDFNNCIEDGLTINGEMTFSTSFDLLTADFDAPMTSNFSNLTISAGSNGSTLSGSMTCRFNELPNNSNSTSFSYYPNSMWCNQNLLVKDSTSKKVYKFENYESISIDDISAGIELSFYKGRYYHPDFGYVDISDGPNDLNNSSGHAVLVHITSTQELVAGSGMLTGANQSAAEMVITSSTTYDLYLDADGDSNFDSPISVVWQ